jgi:hypothetical protein
MGAVQTRRLSRHDPERSAMTSVHGIALLVVLMMVAGLLAERHRIGSRAAGSAKRHIPFIGPFNAHRDDYTRTGWYWTLVQRALFACLIALMLFFFFSS